MNRRNLAVTAFALTAMAFATISACKKESGGGAAGSSGDMLSYLPKDTTMIVGVSWSKATGSDIFKKYESKIMADAPKELATIKEKCGLDPMKDLGSLVISGGKDIADESDTIIAVKGSFDKAKLEGCVTKMGGTVEGGVMTIEGEPMNIYWPANDTLLLAKGMTADQMKAATKDGSAKDNEMIMGYIKKVDSSATIWAAGLVPAEAAGQMGGMGKPPKGFYFDLSVSSGVNGKVGLVFESEDDAKGTMAMVTMGMTMAKGQVPENMKGMVEKVKTKQDGKAIVISAKFSGKDIDAVEGLVGGML